MKAEHPIVHEENRVTFALAAVETWSHITEIKQHGAVKMAAVLASEVKRLRKLIEERRVQT